MPGPGRLSVRSGGAIMDGFSANFDFSDPDFGDGLGPGSSGVGPSGVGRSGWDGRSGSWVPTGSGFCAPVSWQGGAGALLDDAHLVAWSGASRDRVRFAAELGRFLQQLPGYEVCSLHGRSIATLEQLCEQVERQIPGPALARAVEGSGGLTDFLRSWEPMGGSVRRRARFIVWHDADVLLRADAELFGRVADALMGVAAEGEFGPGERLMIQRVVFCGGPGLAVAADADEGPFRRWRTERQGEQAFWAIISGLEAPPVRLAAIEELMQPSARASA